MVPVLLICSMLCGTVAGNYRQVQAAEVVAGMETIQWIISLAASAGFTIGIADLVGKSRDEVKDWDSYDWGNLLDDPATQKQVDDTEKQIEDYYNNAVKDWYIKHGGQLSPSPAPTTTPQPPVTVAPIDPDTVEPPIDWDTLKKKTEETGILSMMGATLACMREGLVKFWDDIMKTDYEINVEDNPYKNYKCIGYWEFDCTGTYQGEYIHTYRKAYIYDKYNDGQLSYISSVTWKNAPSNYHTFRAKKSSGSDYYGVCSYVIEKRELSNGRVLNNTFTGDGLYNYPMSYDTGTSGTLKETYVFSVPVVIDGETIPASKISNPKAAIIPDLTRKQAYDNNASIGDSTSSGSGSSSGSDTDSPFNFKIPTIDEIKDFLKDLMGGDEDDQPTKVTNFITNHTVQPTPAPNPTTAPDPGGGDSGGGTTDPDNPDSPDDTGIDDYKTDLRLVFPFCIPFDLIHLLNVFDAEPEAPVFEFPLDIELNNPFSGGKVVDYHYVFTLDMSDYESVVEILRIFQVIFFIIALMMITRQQMIKG